MKYLFKIILKMRHFALDTWVIHCRIHVEKVILVVFVSLGEHFVGVILAFLVVSGGRR